MMLHKMTKDVELNQEFELKGEINHELHLKLAQGVEDVKD